MAKENISKMKRDLLYGKIYLSMITWTTFDLQFVQKTHMTPHQEDK